MPLLGSFNQALVRENNPPFNRFEKCHRYEESVKILAVWGKKFGSYCAKYFSEIQDLDWQRVCIPRWLGLTDIGREGDWMWIHSSRVELQHFQCSKDQTGRQTAFLFLHSFHSCKVILQLQKAGFSKWGRGAPSRKKKNAQDQAVTTYKCWPQSKIYTILAFRASCDKI